jgi:translation initiation factor IF-3
VKTLQNEEISTEHVMLVDENGKMVGKVSTKYALSFAQNKGLDLVEVQQKEIPVCKIMDQTKETYKKRRNVKKSQKSNRKKTKELKIGLSISEHDLQTKISQMSKFLSNGHLVKLTLRLKGREMSMGESFIEEKAAHILESIKVPYKKEGNMKKGSNFWSVTLSAAKK